MTRRACVTAAAILACLGAPGAAARASDDAREILAENFPGIAAPVDTTAGVGPGSVVQGYVGNRGGIIRHAGGARYVVSTAPIRTSDRRPVDLRLTEVPGNTVRPVAAPTT